MTTPRQLKVFICEDDPDRIRSFARWFGHGLDMDSPIRWDCIQTSGRDYEFVPPYDFIFLDHDLGGRQLEAHEDDGVALVRLIKDRISSDTPIIVHSFNNHGANNMVRELQGVTSQVAAIPFGSREFRLNIAQLQEAAGLEVTSL